MKPHRVLSMAAALGLFAVFIPATTSLVLAWSPPGIASVCSDDQAVHNWTVTLPTEADYNIQWADNAGFASPTDVTMNVGANSLSTPASVTTLYVRWASDTGTRSSATWSGGSCSTASPSGTPFESFQGETATPGGTTTPPPTGAGSDRSSNNSTPLFALFICLAFGGLCLVAVEAQRRSIRR